MLGAYGFDTILAIGAEGSISLTLSSRVGLHG